MIASLRGRLIEKDPEGAAVIEAAGVGYLVSASAWTMQQLPPVGADVQVYVHTHATQDGPLQLFAFFDPEERRLFQILLSVQGVGPKVALAILSGLPTEELVRAISSSDVARLTQIRGVGRKTAERLAVELRDKVATFPTRGGGTGGAPSSSGAGRPPPGRLGEVHAGLIALGFRPGEMEAVVAELNPELPVPDLIKQALAALRRR